jgi:hypothetical protein
MLIIFLMFSLNKNPLCQINCKINCNLITLMQCNFICNVHYNVLKYVFRYIYRLYFIYNILIIYFQYILGGLNILNK